jgi:demethylmenaquinone methyltransferase/2-methoxy-6-polyprenyl-1,4-benzoquinol methylase
MITGASPAGVEAGDEGSAARYVRRMFGRVAPRYDLLNHLLSFQMDRYWRRFTVEQTAEAAKDPGARILDLCCGTGDLLAALRRVHGGTVYGVDFCRPMLAAAAAKLGKKAALVEADALRLPLAGESFDLVTVAFGLRNLAHYQKGLAEMHRLLRRGGLLAVLEFSRPQGRLIGGLFGVYFRYVLPWLGGAISGAGGAYRYLQQSVDRFLSPEELRMLLLETGFREVRYRALTGGIAVLHVARK